MKKEQLDDVDIQILKILSRKSNTSYREIKQELNISIGTIHNRINKLKAENGGEKEYVMRTVSDMVLKTYKNSSFVQIE